MSWTASKVWPLLNRSCMAAFQVITEVHDIGRKPNHRPKYSLARSNTVFEVLMSRIRAVTGPVGNDSSNFFIFQEQINDSEGDQ
jgi:hypothetical protein